MMSDIDDAGKPARAPVKIRIKIDDTTARGVYANTAVVHHNDAEFVLDFLFSELPRMQAQVVSRVITNPRSAKQLAQGLSSLIARYEARFGEIPLPQTPSMDEGNYH
jgi:hypothetical protein